jgi:hypothetical protein
VDWIEHVFHVDPDGGSGVAELVIVAAAVIVVAGAVWRLAARTIRSRVAAHSSEE